MKTSKLTIYLVIIVAMMFGTLMVLLQAPWSADASVVVGNEYNATTTDTQALFANYRVIRGNSQGAPTTTSTVLGSIVITTPGTSPMCFYNATSTVTNAEAATSTIACFGASAAAGTYTFDASYNRGILVEFTGSPTATTRASTTITYR